MKKAVSLLSLTTPNSNRKRRRLRDTLAQLTKETEISPFPPPRKRPSAEHNLSMVSLLDISNTPETCKALAGRDWGLARTWKSSRTLFFGLFPPVCDKMNASLSQKIEQGTVQGELDRIMCLGIAKRGGNPGTGVVCQTGRGGGEGLTEGVQEPLHNWRRKSSSQEILQVRFAAGAATPGQWKDDVQWEKSNLL